MKKILQYSLLIICISIYVASSNDSLSKYIYDFKHSSKNTSKLFIGSDKYTYGDLYGMSYLSSFKENNPVKSKSYLNIPNGYGSKKINLYVFCDSYINSFINEKKYFRDVNNLSLLSIYGDKLYSSLDSSRKNILLLELSERNFRSVLSDSNYTKQIISIQKYPGKKIINTYKSTDALTKNKLNDEKQSWFYYFLKGIKNWLISTWNDLFNKNINTNLQSNIWDSYIFSGIKGLRADLNYNLFNQIDKNVKLSKKPNQLFYSPTIDTNLMSSSFKFMSKGEEDTLITRLNYIYNAAKKSGFKEIYLSIIPNPVSIIEPEYDGLKYNNLVERIQGSKNLKMHPIDIFEDFKAKKNEVYSHTDTHWNFIGANIWLTKFNNELIKN